MTRVMLVFKYATACQRGPNAPHIMLEDAPEQVLERVHQQVLNQKVNLVVDVGPLRPDLH